MKENSKLRMRAAMAMSSGALMLRRLGPRALVVASCAAALAPARARAAEPGPATAADVARLQGEVDRLKQDMRDQRELILQLMQAEQQRYDIILKVLRAGGGGEAAIPPPPSPASAMQKGVSGEAKEGTGGAPGGHESATISGHVRSNGGQAIGEAYVFVDGLRSNPGRGHTVEIKQKDKQFSPRVAVVPLGTRLIFPNQDTVIHNVFSTAAGNSFDLGSVKGGGDLDAGDAAQAGRRGDLLQHPLEDARRRARRAERPLDARLSGRLVLDLGRPRGLAQGRALEPDPEADLAAGRREREGGDGHLRLGGDGGPAAHEQARAGVRLLR